MRTRDPLMQHTALAILPRFGGEGRALALAAARRGELSAETYGLLSTGADAAGRAALAEAALEAQTVASGLARYILEKEEAALRQSDRLKRLVEQMAETHADPWVREAAHRRLATLDADAGATLVVRSALYGARGKIVDVTKVLRRLVEGGSLRARATNELAGDPLPGITKDLIIEYEIAGRRFVRTIREGLPVRLP